MSQDQVDSAVNSAPPTTAGEAVSVQAEPAPPPAEPTQTGLETPPTEPAQQAVEAGFSLPGADSDDETKAAFSKELNAYLGVPENADGYSLPDAPEGWSDEFKAVAFEGEKGLNALREKMHAAGATPEQADAAMGYVVDLYSGIGDEFSKGMQAQLTAGQEALTKAFGSEDKVNEALTKTAKTFEGLGVNLTEIFGDDGGLGAAMMPPKFKVALVKLAQGSFEDRREPTIPQGANGGTVLSRDAAEKRRKEISTDPKLYNQLMRQEPTITAEYKRLMEIITNG